MKQSDSESSLLAECPRCDYSLRGLPVEHRCPECGLHLDRHWTIAAPFQPIPSLFRKAGPLVSLILFALFASWVRACFHERNWVGLAVSGFLALLVLNSIVRELRGLLKRPPGFIALGETGLVVSPDGDTRELYPWNHVLDVYFDGLAYGIRIELPDREVHLPGHLFFRGSTVESQECIGRINAYRRRVQFSR